MSYICEACGKVVEDKDKFGSGRFCSRKCSNSHVHSAETKQKISQGVRKKTICTCRFCGRTFDTLTARASHERLCLQNPEEILSPAKAKRLAAKASLLYKTNTGVILDITNHEIAEYFDQQTTCEICGKTIEEANKWDSKYAPKRLCVDHDHRTNKFRGLLCSVCNRQLGWYEANKEAIDKYLNK